MPGNGDQNMNLRRQFGDVERLTATAYVQTLTGTQRGWKESSRPLLFLLAELLDLFRLLLVQLRQLVPGVALNAEQLVQLCVQRLRVPMLRA
jgi:hypothetical protein